MRSLILILLCVAVLPAFSQDSLRVKHYKVRFSVQAKYEGTVFNYLNVSNEINQYKTYDAGFYARYERRVQSENLLNPEIKMDFELPLWLKITCGAHYNRLKYSIRVPRYKYSSINIYAPGSTSSSHTVTGTSSSSTHVGYNADESEVNWISTFVGFGISKQYKDFNFDADYSFALNKVTDAYTKRRIYDLDNNQKGTQFFMFMEDYLRQRDNVFFTHQFSSAFSYRLYKHLHVKAGFQYSKADSTIEDRTYKHYSVFKHMRSYAFIAGIVISRL